MADDDWSEEVQGGGVIAPRIAELPEIKLFGRWNCDDVQVNDMSLQVNTFGIVIKVLYIFV